MMPSGVTRGVVLIVACIVDIVVTVIGGTDDG